MSNVWCKKCGLNYTVSFGQKQTARQALSRGKKIYIQHHGLECVLFPAQNYCTVCTFNLQKKIMAQV